MMIELKPISEPVDQVFRKQSNVIAVFESQNLGMGTLFLTESTVHWINDDKHGLILTYRAISVHAASQGNEQFPDPSLFLLVDVSKLDFAVTKDEQEDGSSDDEDTEIRTITIRFVPADPAAIHDLYLTMNRCQELNPDSDEELSDEEEDFEGGGADAVFQPFDGAAGDGLGNQWYTADNIGETVELNEEGMANLSRILANSNKTNGSAETNGHHEEPMEE